MNLADIASIESFRCGVDYYEAGKVKEWQQTGDQTYSGTVEGSKGRSYTVSIDLEHPRKSVCGCPFNLLITESALNRFTLGADDSCETCNAERKDLIICESEFHVC